MRWNLRLAAAQRGIWKASQLRRMLADRGVVISAGKMLGLWSGRPSTIRLHELDAMCAVLGCGVEELLLPEPERVPEPHRGVDEQTTAVGQAPPRDPAHQHLREVGLQHPARDRRTAAAAATPGTRFDDLVQRAVAARAGQLGAAQVGRPPVGESVLRIEARPRTPPDRPGVGIADVFTDPEPLPGGTVPPIRSWIDRRDGDPPAGYAAGAQA
jgi:Predicted transcriptional regulator